MPPSSSPEETRAAVTARYSGLARAARSGQQIRDCGPGPGYPVVRYRRPG